MPTRTDQAIVLRLSDYSESSQIVSLFTASAGLVRLIAKGSRRGTRKRFAPGLDLLEYGHVTYAPRRGEAGLGILTEWVQHDAFMGLRAELPRQYGALYAVELVTALTEEYDPHPPLFEALLELLRRLSEERPQRAEAATVTRNGRQKRRRAFDDLTAAIVRFQKAILKAIGYAPLLRQCVDCGRARVRGTRAYFSSTAGGVLCRDCEIHHVEKRPISPVMLDGNPDTQIPADWFDLLDYHLSHVAGRAFKTAGPLGALLAYEKHPPSAH